MAASVATSPLVPEKSTARVLPVQGRAAGKPGAGTPPWGTVVPPWNLANGSPARYTQKDIPPLEEARCRAKTSWSSSKSFAARPESLWASRGFVVDRGLLLRRWGRGLAAAVCRHDADR